jgi:hypothetical protein
MLEILLYVALGLLLIFWIIPLAIFTWSSMFSRGILHGFLQTMKKDKNEEQEEK